MKSLVAGVAFSFVAATTVKAQTVTLDYYFNNEYKKNATTGQLERFHYTWEDKASSGYSIWGDIFKRNGAQLKSLEAAPTSENLKGSDIYIIVDPDTEKETAHPNYINENDIKAITAWVKTGGVLVLLANDSANCELTHLNKLSEKFGIHFNNDLRNKVDGNRFEMAAFNIRENDPIFKTAKKIYMKEICSLRLESPAVAELIDKNDIIIGVSKYGRGTVFAVGDPWFYNEYCNGRLTTDYDNDKAADDLSKWLIQQTKKRR
jgi:unsaturated rhamnogalacturonyl hydrolase